MTPDEAKKRLSDVANGGYERPAKMREIAFVITCEIERLEAKVSGQLPNGGYCVEGCKNSMKPTTKNDTL
jgi:hypothetical protein